MSVTSGQLYFLSHVEYTFQKGGNERETRKGGTEKRTTFGTDRQTDRQMDRRTEVHIEVVPT